MMQQCAGICKTGRRCKKTQVSKFCAVHKEQENAEVPAQEDPAQEDPAQEDPAQDDPAQEDPLKTIHVLGQKVQDLENELKLNSENFTRTLQTTEEQRIAAEERLAAIARELEEFRMVEAVGEIIRKKYCDALDYARTLEGQILELRSNLASKQAPASHHRSDDERRKMSKFKDMYIAGTLGQEVYNSLDDLLTNTLGEMSLMDYTKTYVVGRFLKDFMAVNGS